MTVLTSGEERGKGLGLAGRAQGPLAFPTELYFVYIGCDCEREAF